MGLNFSSSKSSSTPVDMTPGPFKGLQGPLAQRIMGLLGFSQAPTTAPHTGTTGFNPTGAPTGQPLAYKDAHPGWTDTGRSAGTQNGVAYNWFTGGGMNGDAQGGNGRQMQRFAATPPAGTNTGGGNDNPWTLNAGADGLGGIPKYQGPLTADMSPNETALLSKLMAESNGTAPDSAAEAALKEFIHRGLDGNASVDNPFMQSYIQAAQRPTQQALEESLGRTLPGRFTLAGQQTQPQSSSAFDRAAAIATRGAADAMGDIATKISYQQANDAQTRGLDAAKSLPGVSAQEVDTLIQNLKAQSLPRLIKEQGIDRGMQLFQTRLDALLKTLGITAGVTQPTIANQQDSKSTGFGLSLK